MTSIIKYIFILALPLLLISCGDDASSTGSLKATGRMPTPKKVAAKKKVVAVKKAATVVSTEDGDQDVRSGLRNPFQSYIVHESALKDDRVLGPLECCELSLFRLMAVISGTDRPRALIMAPDGQRHITKKGDIMGLRGGKIIKIYRDKIVIEEKFKDPKGKKVIKELVEIRLPSKEAKKRK